MKLIIISILFSASLSAKLTWQCPSVSYDESQVKKLPHKQELEVELVQNGGDARLNLKPDIFEKFQNPEKSFRSFFNSDNKKSFYVDSTACIRRFKGELKDYLKNNEEELCKGKSGSCLDIEKLLEKTSEHMEKKISSATNELRRLPPYYTGHALKKNNYTPVDYKVVLNSFCQGLDVDKLIMTSRDMIQYTANIASNPLTNIPRECLEKVENFYEESVFEDNCDQGNYLCILVQEDTKTYKNRFSNLKDARVQALKSEKDLQNWGAYRIANTAQAAKIANRIKEIVQYPAGGCRYNMTINDNGLTPTIFFYDSAISDAIPYIKQNLNRGCKINLLMNYMHNKAVNDDPLTSTICKNRSCEDIKQAKNLFNQNIQELIKDIYGESSLQYACYQQPNLHNGTFEIQKFISEIENVSSCTELKLGTPKVVTGSMFGSTTNYSMEKLSDKKIKINVGMAFLKNPNSKITSEELFEKTKACLKGASSYMRSPTGESFDINILGPDELSALPESGRPKLNEIKIKPEGFRSNSLAYEESIDCATITHEVLHLLGLVDEYHEKTTRAFLFVDTGKVVKNKTEEELKKLENEGKIQGFTRYQCRAVPQSDSIMRNQWDIMNKTIGTQVRCECIDENCKEMFSSPNKDVRKILTGSLWSGITSRNALCTYETVKSKAGKKYSNIIRPSQLQDYPFHNIIGETDDAIIFEHTEVEMPLVPSKLLYPTVYRYTCSKCVGKQQCGDLDTLKERVRGKVFYPIRSCPNGSEEISKKILPADSAEKPNVAIQDNSFVITAPAVNKNSNSLLHPAQFARIKHGVCADKVKSYNACAKYAYKDRDPEDCLDKPKACEDESKWLMLEE